MEPSQAPTSAETECRLCGGPAGPSEECPSCERELDSYLAGLLSELSELEETRAPVEVGAPAASPPPEARPQPARPALEAPAKLPPLEVPNLEPPAPEEASPPAPPRAQEPRAATGSSRRRLRPLLAVLALGALALVIALAATQGDEEGGSAADGSQGPATDPPAAAKPDGAAQSAEPAGFGRWSGEVEVAYEDGTRDELAVALDIGVLEPGKRVGTAATTQNDTECRGSLTSLGRLDGVFRFAYREQNTAECVARSRITLTPRGPDRVAYRETTAGSVNRGFLTRE